MSGTLVDSSVWIAFFRGDREAVRRLDPIISEDGCAITGVVLAEVLSGAKDRTVFRRLQSALRALEWLPELPDVWDRVAETRFALARSGYQVAIADVLVAVTAAHFGHELLTRDRDFERIAPLLSLDLVVF